MFVKYSGSTYTLGARTRGKTNWLVSIRVLPRFFESNYLPHMSQQTYTTLLVVLLRLLSIHQYKRNGYPKNESSQSNNKPNWSVRRMSVHAFHLRVCTIRS